MSKKIVVAICGASGVIYGVRLLKALLERETHVSLVISKAGLSVLKHEMGYASQPFDLFLEEQGTRFHENATLKTWDDTDFFAPPASGSARFDAMVIAPCTMGTLGAIGAGISSNLIHRAADVTLKEKRPLILLPRETPLNRTHLRNMLQVAEAGATIIPPSPSFYSMPRSMNDLVDTVIARVLDHLEVEHNLVKRWGSV